MTQALLQQLNPFPGERRRVVVAMSGGVDSSVTAALLHDHGHDVIGVTLQLYDHGQATARTGACCAGQDIHDARRVAEHIGIPHYVLDYEARFRKSVIESFADSYASGHTPVPCITCNQTVKFVDLLNASKDLGAEAMATGHYIERRSQDGRPQLFIGPDLDRDQSYFLFATTAAQLDNLAFPLGTLEKSVVRQLADHFALPVAQKPDSQDICFVPNGRYADIVARLRPDSVIAGDIVDLNGNVLGQHDGIINFTIGQRRGLGIATGEPLFVTRLDTKSHRVIVGPRSALTTTLVQLKDINWLGDESEISLAADKLDIYAKVRSTQLPKPATLYLDRVSNSALVELAMPENGIAPGQACVFYNGAGAGAQLLGGGWIERTSTSSETTLPLENEASGQARSPKAIAETAFSGPSE